MLKSIIYSANYPHPYGMLTKTTNFEFGSFTSPEKNDSELIKEPSFTSDSYRFGFGGQEKDDEVSGSGNNIDFGARIYDSRLGRWMSCDTKFSMYPEYSPYNYVINNPVTNIDPNGEWVEKHVQKFYRDKNGVLWEKRWYNVFKKTAHIEVNIVIHNAKAFIMFQPSRYDDIQRKQSAELMMAELIQTYSENYNKNDKGPVTNIDVEFKNGIKFIDHLKNVKSRGRKKDNLIIIAPPNAISDLNPYKLLSDAGAIYFRGLIVISPDHAYLTNYGKIESIKLKNRVFSHEFTHHWVDDENNTKEINQGEDIRPENYLMYNEGSTGYILEKETKDIVALKVNSIHGKWFGFKQKLKQFEKYSIKKNYKRWDE